MNSDVSDKMKKSNPIIYNQLSDYKFAIISFLVSGLIFYSVRFLEKYIYQVFGTNQYLIFHTIVEFASIIMCVASFLVVYYVGDRDKRLRIKVLAGVLLLVGCIDFWHTFSYNGMPGLLVPSSVQGATTYWIIGRFILAGGILLCSFISIDVNVHSIRKSILVGLPLFLSLFILYILSYYPTVLPPLFIEGEGLTPLKNWLEYVIILMMFIAFIKFLIEYGKSKRNTLAYMIVALIVSMFSELAFTNYGNVYDTYNLLGHVYKLIASYMIFRLLFIFNINYPYEELDKAEKEISKYANNLEVLVRHRTEEVEIANEQLLQDLEYAKSIQKAIMPIKHENFDNVEVYSEYIAFEKVGGDFYGFENLGSDQLSFYIGDVAGHGVPAAMMTIFLKQTLVMSNYHNSTKEFFHPKEVIQNLYREYNDTDFPLEMYAVMLYGIFNKKNNEMIFSSGGLNTFPLIYEGEGNVRVVEHTGFPICKFGEEFCNSFNEYTVQLYKGNKVLFYTDGLIEITNIHGEDFSEARLVKVMSEYGHLSPKELSYKITKEIKRFSNGVKPKDDIHYFIVELH
ncbi:sigma-B regulation protein RsbU (phosphoserine phosphatase) [Alkalibaculum bacchi]|uniref:Sigma-B regulation protein RsbU (Phosphoserine phosphatase) n=1 Tax=Alkalibaculum bacchi TaxID=645887 RepID=A0A366I1M5_9FIRM|nr:MASE3 domain-containing protein [Alkalibaculum bacchi]RBP59683.1 sigma-B regulation protein RsbU (phosphoserine phosphatase) [Alkalibaculum bacchi]